MGGPTFPEERSGWAGNGRLGGWVYWEKRGEEGETVIRVGKKGND